MLKNFRIFSLRDKQQRDNVLYSAPVTATTYATYTDCPLTIEEETDRREGKGRHCCSGDGIHSISCRTTDLVP